MSIVLENIHPACAKFRHLMTIHLPKTVIVLKPSAAAPFEVIDQEPLEQTFEIEPASGTAITGRIDFDVEIEYSD